jgi:hypothetical protein
MGPISCQLSVVSCQLSVVSGQLSVEELRTFHPGTFRRHADTFPPPAVSAIPGGIENCSEKVLVNFGYGGEEVIFHLLFRFENSL